MDAYHSSVAKAEGQSMTTTEKGNKLEDELFDYLLDQINRDKLVFDAHPAGLCKVYRKKKYYCDERRGDVEFDVVVEVRRKGRTEPYLYVVFECKNHQKAIEEIYVTDFSDKLHRIFGHAAKGIVVTSFRLQSGAESLAIKRRLGIVKFDKSGIDVVADRAVGGWAENSFIQTQIFDGNRRPKSLKFAACVDGRYFGSFEHMLHIFEKVTTDVRAEISGNKTTFLSFLPEAEIQGSAQKALCFSGYNCGEVDVERLCSILELNLSYSERVLQDAEGNIILGSANFNSRSIEINQHGNRNRERFTVAHEIGHFLLRHDKYLRSDTIVEQDLYDESGTTDIFNYERLEHQANLFASFLLLPEDQFRKSVDYERKNFETYGRSFGYIFVDDQRCNYIPYNQMLAELSDQFGASKQVVEIRLKRAGLVTDNRIGRHTRQFLGPLHAPRG